MLTQLFLSHIVDIVINVIANIAQINLGLNKLYSFFRIQHTKHINITRQHLTIRLCVYGSESSPERWYDVRYNEGLWDEQNIYANKREKVNGNDITSAPPQARFRQISARCRIQHVELLGSLNGLDTVHTLFRGRHDPLLAIYSAIIISFCGNKWFEGLRK